MNRGVTQTLNDVDVVLFVVEAGRYDAKDKSVVRLLPKDRPVVLVVNKTDQLKDRNALLPFLATAAADFDYAAVVPISAAKGRQTEELLAEARKHLPNEGLMFPEDDLTDKSERFLASEYIREKSSACLAMNCRMQRPWRSKSSRSRAPCGESTLPSSSTGKATRPS